MSADRPNMHDVRTPGILTTIRERVRDRRGDDRGATMIEAAFVTPVFIMLLFGIFEFSGYVAAQTGANAAVKAGARMATVAGDNPMADRSILNRMSREGAGLVASNDVVLQIKIWHASSPQDNPPATCNAASQCNLYVDPNQSGGAYNLASLPLTTDSSPTATMSPSYSDCYFGYASGQSTAGGCSESGRLDSGWPPTNLANPNLSRRILEKSPNHAGACTNRQCDTTDLVGIWIQVRHDYYTGFFGHSVTVTSKTVAKIEPQGYDK